MYNSSENYMSLPLKIHNENTITFTAHIDLKEHSNKNLLQVVTQGLQSSHLLTRRALLFVGRRRMSILLSAHQERVERLVLNWIYSNLRSIRLIFSKVSWKLWYLVYPKTMGASGLQYLKKRNIKTCKTFIQTMKYSSYSWNSIIWKALKKCKDNYTWILKIRMQEYQVRIICGQNWL